MRLLLSGRCPPATPVTAVSVVLSDGSITLKSASLAIYSQDQWFSAFPELQPLNTIAHVLVTPNHRTISMLLPNRNLATVLNHNVKL